MPRIRTSIRLLATVLLVFALSGCCGVFVQCDACPPNEGLTFVFETEPAKGGFQPGEIRSAYVVRYTLNNYLLPLDTLRQPTYSPYTYSSFEESGVVLFSTEFSYRIVVPSASRQYDITDIELSYEESSGCCGCNQLRRRKFKRDNVLTIADAGDTEGVILRR
ncbi:hypothetical protein [Hymenobacter psychrotolerans]|uniref:Lipoprotein n=1 Tax=Hymenobacter psychrotolerans DSM 18569 TaxID=1121959 RepID=A0A1M7DMU2_9BACT|nr:hypothetical protein [Hymenobacter psychrotolerans]SHL80727.1 hypothetical protein SAMN02746009_03402 [Hymenobacter psychrotolerans DSM 18569]